MNIKLLAKKTWEFISADLSDREIEILDFIYCHLNKHAEVADITIELANKHGYTEDEVMSVCKKMEDKELVENNSELNSMFASILDGYENAFGLYYLTPELTLIYHNRYEKSGYIAEDEENPIFEYLMHIHDKPEWKDDMS